MKVLFRFLILCFCSRYAVASGRLSLIQAAKEMTHLGILVEQVKEILKGETVINVLHDNEAECQLLVNNTHFSSTILETIKDIKPNLILETLTPIFDAQRLSRLEFLNSILCLRSLTGLQYYDPLEKCFKELILGAYTIDTPFSGSGRADYLLAEIPQFYTVYLRQSDTLFGLTTFRLDYYLNEDEIIMMFTNVVDLQIKGTPFKLASRESFSLILQYIPFSQVKEGLFYTAIFVNSDSELLLRDKLVEKLLSMMNAMQGWFVRDFIKRKIL